MTSAKALVKDLDTWQGAQLVEHDERLEKKGSGEAFIQSEEVRLSAATDKSSNHSGNCVPMSLGNPESKH